MTCVRDRATSGARLVGSCAPSSCVWRLCLCQCLRLVMQQPTAPGTCRLLRPRTPPAPSSSAPTTSLASPCSRGGRRSQVIQHSAAVTRSTSMPRANKLPPLCCHAFGPGGGAAPCASSSDKHQAALHELHAGLQLRPPPRAQVWCAVDVNEDVLVGARAGASVPPGADADVDADVTQMHRDSKSALSGAAP